MINNKHKCIFVHIPKTAGTSIHYIFNYTVPVPYVDKLNRERDHFTAVNYRENMSNYNMYYKFTFTRNPWDKLVSEYRFFKSGSEIYPEQQPRIFDTKNITFAEFIVKLQNTNFSDYSHYDRSHYIPQVDYILDENHTKIIDFIGRFENLQEDFDIVCDKIGIPQQQLPHINKTKHKHYTEYYDDETREIVAEKYAKDIEYFNYKFGD